MSAPAVQARSLAGIRAAARTITCGQCAAAPAAPCAPDGGDHLARYVAAARAGLLTTADVGTVLSITPDIFTVGTLIRIETTGSTR